MRDRRLAFLYSPEVEGFAYPAGCPFRTERVGLARQQLRSLGMLGTRGREEIAPRKLALEELSRLHTPRYLEELQRAARGELRPEGLAMGLAGPDTPVFPAMFECGAWACGASVSAAELLLRGEADVAFNLLGGFHHAMAEKAAGFCYLNDAALACLRLADAGWRVAYLDVDAHHGDGVQEFFYRRSDVLTISLHESGRTLFPWGGFENEVGEGEGQGYNLNVPLPALTYDEAFLRAVDEVVMPVLAAVPRDALVLELGMDTLAGDPLTHMCLTNNAHVELVRRLVRLDKPVLVLGGGGYHVQNAVRGWARSWRAFLGEEEWEDFGLGLGGVMLESTEWAGGLRDRELPVTPARRASVEPELAATLQRVKQEVFRYHGLAPSSGSGEPPGAGQAARLKAGPL